MKRFIIDTDAASDDAVAIIMALRDPSVKVEAITITFGYRPLPIAERNTLIIVEKARSYHPPVFLGIDRPFIRGPLRTGTAHGEDGLGDVGYSDPKIKSEQKHAVDAIIDLVKINPGEIELITLGPLTNIAMAILKDPTAMKGVKKIVMMGGTQLGHPAYTPSAEFNIIADPEAADIVFRFGIPFVLVPLEACFGSAEITEDDLKNLKSFSNETADFCADCNYSLAMHNKRTRNHFAVTLYDAAAVVAAIKPELIEKSYPSKTLVDVFGSLTYGQTVIDIKSKDKNSEIISSINGDGFKQYLFELVR